MSPVEPAQPAAEFVSEYLGRLWEPTPEEKRLRELAECYHEETEAYDQGVCAGRTKDGVAMPVTSHQSSLIHRHARKVHERLFAEAQSLGFDRRQWHQALRANLPSLKITPS